MFKEDLAHQIATKIYEKTGVAIDSDDPTVLLTLGIAEVIEDINNKNAEKLNEFLSSLELSCEKVDGFNEKIDKFTTVTKQVILNNAKKEIDQTVSESVKNVPEQIDAIVQSIPGKIEKTASYIKQSAMLESQKNRNIFIILIILQALTLLLALLSLIK